MPLPHLKQKNNVDQEEFVSVDQEMANAYRHSHPMTPAREMPNPELDTEPANDDEDPAATD
jgi:hypothetical protein